MAIEDIIWGKNRHIFGGIEPSNMKTFKVTAKTNKDGIYDRKVTILAQIPNNTIVDGQTLCTVSGAVIRKSSDHYPNDEFDGDFVADIKCPDIVSIIDTDISDTTSAWYYAAFPYTTQGIYNRNPANRSSVNESWALDNFVARLSVDERAIELELDIPDSGYNPITRVVIRRSTDHYPMTLTDGEEVTTITSIISNKASHIDRDVEVNMTYYYSAFPMNNVGNYNITDLSTACCTVREYAYFYGYDIVLSDSNPDTRVTYDLYVIDNEPGLEGIPIDNASYTTPARLQNQNSTGVFDYGDWAEAGFMPKPCMLKYDGTVAYYLDPNDYDKRKDGNPSNVSDTRFEGNAMMEWSQIWTKRFEITDSNGNKRYCFRCSNVQLTSDYECWCNYDRNGNRIKHFYTSIFAGYLDNTTSDTKLRSISGHANLTCPEAQAYFTRARNNGEDWTIETFADRLLINDLLVLISRSTNGEASFGYGAYKNISSTADSWLRHEYGHANKQGLFAGNITKDKTVATPNKIFGMEDWWGRGSRLLAGWIEVGSSVYLKITRGMIDGSTVDDYNVTGDGYITLPKSEANASVESLYSTYYVTECLTKPYGRFPVKGNNSGGSSSTYECDNFYRNYSNSSARIAMVSTDSADFNDGPFNFRLSCSPEGKDNGLTAGLSCKPCAKGV